MEKKPRKGTERLNDKEVERLRIALGLSLEQLADGIVSPRNMGRILAGQPAYLTTIKALAERLGTEPSQLISSPSPPSSDPSPSPTEFALDIKLAGLASSAIDATKIVTLTTEIIHRLTAAGIQIRHHEAKLQLHQTGIARRRLVVWVQNLYSKGSFYWLFFTVLPEKVNDLAAVLQNDCLEAYTNRVLDFNYFTRFGEVLLKGKGNGFRPPQRAFKKLERLFGGPPDLAASKVLPLPPWFGKGSTSDRPKTDDR